MRAALGLSCGHGRTGPFSRSFGTTACVRQEDVMTRQRSACAGAMLLLLAGLTPACGQAVEQVASLARQERPALLDTVKALVSIESGSRDSEGVSRLADLIAGWLTNLGGQVELVEPSDIYRMEDTPERIG